VSDYYTTQDSDVPLAQQAACLIREAGLREKVYPKWVQQGRMTAEKAQFEIRAMRAAAMTISKQLELHDVSEEMKASEQKREQIKQTNLQL